MVEPALLYWVFCPAGVFCLFFCTPYSFALCFALIYFVPVCSALPVFSSVFSSTLCPLYFILFTGMASEKKSWVVFRCLPSGNFISIWNSSAISLASVCAALSPVSQYSCRESLTLSVSIFQCFYWDLGTWDSVGVRWHGLFDIPNNNTQYETPCIHFFENSVRCGHGLSILISRAYMVSAAKASTNWCIWYRRALTLSICTPIWL